MSSNAASKIYTFGSFNFDTKPQTIIKHIDFDPKNEQRIGRACFGQAITLIKQRCYHCLCYYEEFYRCVTCDMVYCSGCKQDYKPSLGNAEFHEWMHYRPHPHSSTPTHNTTIRFTDLTAEAAEKLVEHVTDFSTFKIIKTELPIHPTFPTCTLHLDANCEQLASFIKASELVDKIAAVERRTANNEIIQYYWPLSHCVVGGE